MAPKGFKRSKLSVWFKGSSGKGESSSAPPGSISKDEAAEAAPEDSQAASETTQTKLYDVGDSADTPQPPPTSQVSAGSISLQVPDAKWGPCASATTVSNSLPTVPNLANASELHGLALAEDRGDLYGLKLLAGPKKEPADLGARVADIIAIHGINGGAWKTWEDKRTGKLWLQDFLPKKIQGARIYSFGYASEVAFTRGRAKLKDYARSLLEGINSVRIEKQTQNRPIIFICHSMGGLVVKQALITASLDRDEYANIRESTRGILFLSTPHRGSDAVSWPKLLSNVGNVALTYSGTSGFTGKFRNDLLNSLEKESQDLVNLTVEFRNQHRGIKIISFVENNATPPLAKPIVDSATGVLGVEGEVVVPMDGCDHHTICRFPSENASYQLVLGHIQRLLPVKPTDLAEAEKALLRFLSFDSMFSRQMNIHNPLKETCKWLFNQPEYQDWISRKNLRQTHGILWLKGKPGSGKSTMMRQAIQEGLDRLTSHDTVLQFYFYGRGKDDLQKNPLGMYRSLLHQLFTATCKVPGDIMSQFIDKRYELGVGVEWELKELQAIFFQALREAELTTSIRLYIDALDECNEEDVREVVLQLCDAAEDAMLHSRVLGIFFSSRHYPTIRTEHCAELWMEKHNGNDVTRYIDSKLSKMYPKLDSPVDEETLQDILKSKSSNVFLWVFLVLPRLLAARQKGASTLKLIELVKVIPKDLRDLFRQLFESITEPEDRLETRRLLQWIVFAKRPLTTPELRHALAFSGPHPPHSLAASRESSAYTEYGEQFNYTLIDMSKGLIEVIPVELRKSILVTSSKRGQPEGEWQYGTVQLIHASVQDFLKEGPGFQLLDSSLKQGLVSKSHSTLLQACLAYIASDEARRQLVLSPLDLRGPYYEYTKSPSNGTTVPNLCFLHYATDLLLFHAMQIKDEDVSAIRASLSRRSRNTNIEAFRTWCRLCDIGLLSLAEAKGFGMGDPLSGLFKVAVKFDIGWCVKELQQGGSANMAAID